MKLKETESNMVRFGQVEEKIITIRDRKVMQRSGEIIADILDDGMLVTDTETTMEVNLALIKFKHTVKRKNKQKGHKKSANIPVNA